MWLTMSMLSMLSMLSMPLLFGTFFLLASPKRSVKTYDALERKR